MFEAQVESASFQLDLSDFPVGLYHAVIRKEESVETVKLMHLK